MDVFFVISGYLIATIIFNEVAAGRFSLIKFYERRARRILPALFLVILCCLPFALVWFSPEDLKAFARGLVGVVTFTANFVFAYDSDYFAASAELNPLLHTWSLAVEEQFYIFFPLLVMFLSRFGRQVVLVALLVFAISSFLLAHWSVVNFPSAAFFLLPARAWELLLGALCAYYLLARPPLDKNLIGECLSLLGLGLILVAVVLFDKSTPIPSIYTLAPTVGACLIIVYAVNGTIVQRVLSTPVFIGVGLISYSAYLWHQPILAFFRYRFDPTHHELLAVFILPVTLGLAYLSWRYVEQPFRAKDRYSQRRIFINSGVASACLLLIGVAGILLQGVPQRFSNSIAHILSFQAYPYEKHYRVGTCMLQPMQRFNEFSDDCEIANSNLIWGDSHAAALYPGLQSTLQLTKFTASMCPPLMGFDAPRRVHCRAINDHVLNKISQHNYPLVLLHANWSFYSPTAVVSGLMTTIEQVKQLSPDSKIVIVGGVVNWGETGLPAVLANQLRNGNGFISHAHKIPVDTSEIESTDQLILDMLLSHEDVLFISSLDKLCDEQMCIAAVKEDKRLTPLAWDYGHLTGAGSEFLASKIVESPLFIKHLAL